MPCAICGRNSYGNDLCPDCEEQAREEEQEPQFEGGKCPYCGEMSWYFGNEFVECKACGAKAKESEDK